MALMPTYSKAETNIEPFPGAETPELFVLPIPYVEPLAAFAPLAGQPMAAFLDSAAGDVGGLRNRYSYIAIDPYRVLSAGTNSSRWPAHQGRSLFSISP